MSSKSFFIFLFLVLCSFSATAYWKEQTNATYISIGGSNYYSGLPGDYANFYDNNYSSQISAWSYIGGQCYGPDGYGFDCGWAKFLINYTGMVSTENNALWMTKTGGSTSNTSLPNDCYNITLIRLAYYCSKYITCEWVCWNYTSPATFKWIHAVSAGVNDLPFEESLFVNYTEPANLTLDLIGNIAFCNESHGVSVVLAMNNSPVVNPYDPGSSPGVYNFNCSFAGNENITANYTTGSFTIFPVVYNVTVRLNESDQNRTGTYPYPINFDCESNGSAVSLYLNASPIVNDTTHDLAAGYYNFSCNSSSDQKSLFLLIEKADSVTSLYLNGTQADRTIVWPAVSNASASANQGTVGLYRNNTVKANPEVASLNPGSYLYTANTSGNENYTGSSVSWVLTVSKATASITLSASPSSITGGGFSNVSCSESHLLPILLYVDGVNVSNPYYDSFAVGTYSFICNTSGNANYSSGSASYSLVVGSTGCDGLLEGWAKFSILMLIFFILLSAWLGRSITKNAKLLSFLTFIIIVGVFALVVLANMVNPCGV